MSTVEEPGRVVVRAGGECDMSTSGELADALTAAVGSSPRTEVDLAGLKFLDSSGIHVLVTAYHHAQSCGGIVYVTHAEGVVAAVLELTGVAALLAAPLQGER